MKHQSFTVSKLNGFFLQIMGTAMKFKKHVAGHKIPPQNCSCKCLPGDVTAKVLFCTYCTKSGYKDLLEPLQLSSPQMPLICNGPIETIYQVPKNNNLCYYYAF